MMCSCSTTSALHMYAPMFVVEVCTLQDRRHQHMFASVRQEAGER